MVLLKTKIFVSISILCFYLFFSVVSVAQDLDVPEDYISEFIYGINFNTNSGLIGGVMMKSTKIIKPKVYRSIGLEIVHIKSPKELRLSSRLTGNSFIFSKRNYFYSFRPQYGRDFILFRKAPEEGIQVSAVFAGGPSIGLQIPYFILYRFPNEDIRSVQYDPNVHDFDSILGAGTVFDGIGQSKIILGAHLKVGISLDFGAFRNSISGVEAGFTFEGFGQRAEIMTSPTPSDVTPNPQFLSAVYATIFFGTRR